MLGVALPTKALRAPSDRAPEVLAVVGFSPELFGPDPRQDLHIEVLPHDTVEMVESRSIALGQKVVSVNGRLVIQLRVPENHGHTGADLEALLAEAIGDVRPEQPRRRPCPVHRLA